MRPRGIGAEPDHGRRAAGLLSSLPQRRALALPPARPHGRTPVRALASLATARDEQDMALNNMQRAPTPPAPPARPRAARADGGGRGATSMAPGGRRMRGIAYSAPSGGLHDTPGSSLSAPCSFSARRLSDASSSARSFAYSACDGSPSCAPRPRARVRLDRVKRTLQLGEPGVLALRRAPACALRCTLCAARSA